MRLLTYSMTFGLVTALTACSSSTSTSSSSGSDAGTTADAGQQGQQVNGCTAYADHTAAADARKITFPTGAPEQFSPPCMKIKVGQSVTWTGGDFSVHPLEPAGGDSPTPIDTVTSGTADHTIAFPNAGTFGFECAQHPSIMHGAIFVTP